MGRLIGSVGLTPGSDEGTDLTTKGDIHGFSDSNTRIPVGDDDTVLTADSGEALGVKWASASGGGKMELVGSDKLTSAGSSLNVAISPAISMSNIAYLRIVLNVKMDDASAEAQPNLLRINSISTNTYNQDGISVVAGSSSILNNVNQSYVAVTQDAHDGNRFSITDLICNQASENLEMNMAGGGQDGYFTAFAYNSTSSQTTFSDITVLTGAGNMSIDSRLDVYKVSL